MAVRQGAGGQSTPSLLLQPAGTGPATAPAWLSDRPEAAPVAAPTGGAAGEGPGGPGGHQAVQVLQYKVQVSRENNKLSPGL